MSGKDKSSKSRDSGFSDSFLGRLSGASAAPPAAEGNIPEEEIEELLKDAARDDDIVQLANQIFNVSSNEGDVNENEEASSAAEQAEIGAAAEAANPK